MRKLENVEVTHVSYVDKAANKKKFFLTKSEDEPTFETKVRLVTKEDDPQKLVYGVVYEPEVEDSHGDFMDGDTIEKAAHGFMENFQQIDKQHDFTTNAGKVVESYVAPVDMEFEDETITKGSWVLVTKATDEMWESIQKGEFTGYSLAGTAEVEEVEKATKDHYEQNKTRRDISQSIAAFQRAADDIIYDYHNNKTDATKLSEIQSEIVELSELISEIEPVTKSKQTTKSDEKPGLVDMIKSFFIVEKEDEEMDEKVLKKVLEEALTPVNERITKLEKEETDEVEKGEGNPEPEEGKKDEGVTADAVAKVVAEAVKPLNEKIEKLEKSRVSNVTEQNYKTESVEKADETPGYVQAVFPVSE